MGKLFVIVWTSLVVLTSGTARDAGPDDWKAGRRIVKDYVRKTVQVEVQGKLIVLPPPVFDPFDPIDPEVYVEVNGKKYRLDFSNYRELLEVATKLQGKMARIKGSLQGDIIRVTSLNATEKTEVFFRQTIEIEIQGPLDHADSPGFPLLPWTITVDGQTYNLDFGANKELLEKARLLKGQKVILTGTVEVQELFQLAIEPVRPPHCLPPNYQVVRVTDLAEALLGK